MSYIEDIESQLRQLFAKGVYVPAENATLLAHPLIEDIVAFVKDKLAQSFRNGLNAAAKNPAGKQARPKKPSGS